MNRTGAIRTATLIALPFLLLPAGIWLGLTAARQFPILDWWGVVRWSVRAVYIGGAYWGWRAGRPRWFYPWLGFAVYEAVATLLSLAVLVMDGLFFRHNGAVAGYLGLALFPLVSPLTLQSRSGSVGNGRNDFWPPTPSFPTPR